MRKIVVLLVGLAVLVLGATWIVVATADDDPASASAQPGSMMSTGVAGESEDGLGMMPGAGRRDGRRAPAWAAG